MDDVVSGAPSAPEAPPSAPAVTPADQAVATGDQSAYREARRAERSGTSLPSSAGSAPAQPAEQAASTDAPRPPASEPGKPPKNADTRVQELLADRAAERHRADRAERELEALRRPPADVTPAASSPAPAVDPSDPEPNEAEYEDYGKYVKAQARWEARQEIRAVQADARQAYERQQQQRAFTTRDETFRAHLTAATAADPDFLSKISDDVKALKPFDARQPGEAPTAYHAIAEELLTSPLAASAMRHFSDHPDDLHRFGALAPREFQREWAKLELQLEAAASPAPQPARVTSAPRPPTTLGGKPTVSADPVDAAVASGDMGAYKEARRAQRAAQMR